MKIKLVILILILISKIVHAQEKWNLNHDACVQYPVLYQGLEKLRDHYNRVTYLKNQTAIDADIVGGYAKEAYHSSAALRQSAYIGAAGGVGHVLGKLLNRLFAYIPLLRNIIYTSKVSVETLYPNAYIVHIAAVPTRNAEIIGWAIGTVGLKKIHLYMSKDSKETYLDFKEREVESLSIGQPPLNISEEEFVKTLTYDAKVEFLDMHNKLEEELAATLSKIEEQSAWWHFGLDLVYHIRAQRDALLTHKELFKEEHEYLQQAGKLFLSLCEEKK